MTTKTISLHHCPDADATMSSTSVIFDVNSLWHKHGMRIYSYLFQYSSEYVNFDFIHDTFVNVLHEANNGNTINSKNPTCFIIKRTKIRDFTWDLGMLLLFLSINGLTRSPNDASSSPWLKNSYRMTSMECSRTYFIHQSNPSNSHRNRSRGLSQVSHFHDNL